MEPSSFDGSLIERWAGFSGDRNPIHFDPRAARRLGTDDVVVHGMIPMVLAQESAYRELRLPPGPGWAECRIRLKRPVKKGQEVRLSVRPAAPRLRFSLASAAGEEQFFLGTFERLAARPAAAEEPPAGARRVDLRSFSLEASYLRARDEELRGILPWIQSAWISFSAALFSEFLTRNLKALEAVTREVAGPAQPVVAVQTTQAVGFDELHFTRVFPKAGGGYRCAFAPAALYAIGGGCTTEGWCRAFYGEQLVMELGVGLLLKVAAP